MVDVRIRNGEVLVDGMLSPVDVLIEQGKISGIVRRGTEIPEVANSIDASGKIVIPGVMDTHVHAREPGYTYKEDFFTASVACAAGGVTFFVDMPNTDPTPNTLERFVEHRALAESKAVVDFNHWAMPTIREEIPAIVDAGALGFKFFMKSAHYPYGDEVAIINHAEILETFRAIAQTGRPCLVHPHDQEIWEYQTTKATEEGRTSLADWGRVTYGDNDVIETTPIATLAILADAVGLDLRILHIQGRPQLRVVRMLKNAGFRFTAETNPWSFFKLGPLALQAEEDFGANWEALKDGTIDIIGSDHAPHSREEAERAESNSFQSVIIAYPYVEHWLSMYLTEVNRGRLTVAEFSRVASENVARHIGLYPRKGVIKVGSDADLVIVDMGKKAILGETYPVYSKMGYTPYEGFEVQGVPTHTIAAGRIVMENGDVTAQPGSGRFITV